MGLFNFLKGPGFDQLIEMYRNEEKAFLLDVRTPEEYAEGRVPGSHNIPLQEIEKTDKIVREKQTPLYVYCRSGARSNLAAGILRSMGYHNVTDVGGIVNYRGEVVR